MNETYPNISVNSVRLSSDSSGRGGVLVDQKCRKSTGVSTCGARVGFVFQLVRIVSKLGSVERGCVYELSATVIHLVARHAWFAADISVARFAGKSYHETGKNRDATPDEFSRLQNFSFISDTGEEGDIGMRKEEREKEHVRNRT